VESRNCSGALIERRLFLELTKSSLWFIHHQFAYSNASTHTQDEEAAELCCPVA
jgi:hypothetical protein